MELSKLADAVSSYQVTKKNPCKILMLKQSKTAQEKRKRKKKKNRKKIQRK